jgi:hypothetical protein
VTKAKIRKLTQTRARELLERPGSRLGLLGPCKGLLGKNTVLGNRICSHFGEGGLRASVKHFPSRTEVSMKVSKSIWFSVVLDAVSNWLQS